MKDVMRFLRCSYVIWTASESLRTTLQVNPLPSVLVRSYQADPKSDMDCLKTLKEI